MVILNTYYFSRHVVSVNQPPNKKIGGGRKANKPFNTIHLISALRPQSNMPLSSLDEETHKE